MRNRLYTKLVSSFLFPVHEKLKGHSTVAVKKAMEKRQWWRVQDFNAWQLQRLKVFLSDVNSSVPYYRRLFREAGFDPLLLDNVSEIQKIPLLDKKLIRVNTEELKADDAKSLSRFNTGGSSGEPLIFYLGKERVSHDVAAKWRATRWWGVDIGDKEIVIWGSPIEVNVQDRVKSIRDKLIRTRLLPAFEMSSDKVISFINTIKEFRPPMIFGYPSALSHIARQARENGINLKDAGVDVVFVTSERLYDDQRQVIEDTFGCKVANGYGGRDAGFIAHECPQGGMHITADDIIVEIIDDDGKPLHPGEKGEVVITNMATRDFPFIRYRTGDVAVLSDEQCPCGRCLPLLKEIHGRTTDFVVAYDGTVMHGLALIYSLRDIPGIREFKIIQNDLENTLVMLVVNDEYNQESDLKIIQDFKARLGDDVKIELEYVEDIPPEKSGKHRYVVSHVS